MPKTYKYSGTVEVYAHRVAFRYWWAGAPGRPTQALKDELEEEAVDRVTACLKNDYVEGQLNAHVTVRDKDYAIRGWWEIEKPDPFQGLTREAAEEAMTAFAVVAAGGGRQRECEKVVTRFLSKVIGVLPRAE